MALIINTQSQGVSKNVCEKGSKLVRIPESIMSLWVYDLPNVNSLLKYTCELGVDYYSTGHILPAAKFNILLLVALCES